MATDFAKIAQGATLSIRDESFCAYLLTRPDVMVEYVVQYLQHMQGPDIVMTASSPCMQTWKRVSQDYCVNSNQNWLDFVNSDAFMKAGIALTMYLGNIYLDTVTRGEKLTST